MSKNVLIATILVTALAAAYGEKQALAQDSAPLKQTTPVPEPVHAYRLDFTLNEIEDGKRINSRQYSMNMRPDGSNELKIGTRVPVEAKQGEFQYLDVGTNIWSRLEDRHGQLDLVARAEISNFANTEEGLAHDSRRPLIRQLKIDASTIAVLGQPMLVGVVDDPNSKRQFQLEVTVTKLR